MNLFKNTINSPWLASSIARNQTRCGLLDDNKNFAPNFSISNTQHKSAGKQFHWSTKRLIAAVPFRCHWWPQIVFITRSSIQLFDCNENFYENTAQNNQQIPQMIVTRSNICTTFFRFFFCPKSFSLETAPEFKCQNENESTKRLIKKNNQNDWNPQKMCSRRRCSQKIKKKNYAIQDHHEERRTHRRELCKNFGQSMI